MLQDDKSWDHKIFRKCLSWPKGLPITLKLWFQAKNGPYWIFFNQILQKYKQIKIQKIWKKWPDYPENNEIWNFGQQMHKTLRKSLIFVILSDFCPFLLIKWKSPIYNTLRNKIHGFTRLQDNKSWDHKIYRRFLSWPKGLPITLKIWFKVVLDRVPVWTRPRNFPQSIGSISPAHDK